MAEGVTGLGEGNELTALWCSAHKWKMVTYAIGSWIYFVVFLNLLFIVTYSNWFFGFPYVHRHFQCSWNQVLVIIQLFWYAPLHPFLQHLFRDPSSNLPAISPCSFLTLAFMSLPMKVIFCDLHIEILLHVLLC